MNAVDIYLTIATSAFILVCLLVLWLYICDKRVKQDAGKDYWRD